MNLSLLMATPYPNPVDAQQLRDATIRQLMPPQCVIIISVYLSDDLKLKPCYIPKTSGLNASRQASTSICLKKPNN